MNWILFEWKLIIRNKRLRQTFIVSVLLLPSIVYMQFVNPIVQENIMLREWFLWLVFSLPATFFATQTFSIDAMFIEKLVIVHMSIFQLLQAKYRLYSIISVVLFILFLPSMFLEVKLMELVAAFLFSIGFVFCGMFLTSLASYKPFDIKATYFYNFQGFDAGNILFLYLLIIVSMGLTGLLFLLFSETVALIAMSLIGLVFIVTSNIWLKKISTSFEKTKYRRLECFREK